jgi:hypothetical protein
VKVGLKKEIPAGKMKVIDVAGVSVLLVNVDGEYYAIASILVFRSAWTLLDEYFGKSNLWLMLVLGIILTVVALILLDYEVKCELEKRKQV